ncbi:uncharacterized protein LOC121404267 [Drosophila obscura]|uniref:uncharacterized protein LOC121404267 n=1 Tax=Drosophila obscura TaxID=7282 RepID=UPI001BB29B5F|nr:uncharacterized protein LOC121404267 [Drosophila obscura]
MTPSGAVDHAATPAARKQLKWQQVGPKPGHKGGCRSSGGGKCRRTLRGHCSGQKPEAVLCWNANSVCVLAPHSGKSPAGTGEDQSRVVDLSAPAADISEAMLPMSRVWTSCSRVQKHGGSHRMLPQVWRRWAQSSYLPERPKLLHLHRQQSQGDATLRGQLKMSSSQGRIQHAAPKMKLLQLNLNHCAAAQDLLSQTVAELKIDLAVLSEPYKVRESADFILDFTKKAALWMCGDYQFTDISRASGYVRAKVGATWVYSVYLAPSLSLYEFAGILDNLAADVRGRHPVAIGGDFNAWAEEEHTFSRAGVGSVVDLTLVSSSLYNLNSWSISSAYTASDHVAIICHIGQRRGSTVPAEPRWKCYRADSMNTALFAERAANLTAGGNAECMANHVMEGLESACDASMSKRRQYGRHHRPVFWWSENIAQLLRECNHARRRCQRSRGNPLGGPLQVAFRDCRRALKTAIKESKRKCFLALCDTAEHDPWGRAYRALILALSLRPKIFAALLNQCLREGVFPERWKKQKLVLIPKPGKPPGPASSYRPICLIDTAGKLLERVLCSRLTRAITEAGDLSPHQYGFRKAKSTIDAINRVVDIASTAIAGTRWKGGGKEYCLMVTLDIRNAFNTARWSCILRALESFNTPAYLLRMVRTPYFEGRLLLYDTQTGTEQYEVTGGVPQGSVLGPLFWNVMYDGILRLRLPRGVHVVGFADDVAILVVAKELTLAESTCNQTILLIQQCTMGHLTTFSGRNSFFKSRKSHIFLTGIRRNNTSP